MRDLIGATLESEAGALVGGAAFERIRARIDTQYAAYFTGRSGAPTQRLLAAQKRVAAAAETLAEAERREGLLEAAFADLDAARRQLSTLRRELENDPDAAERAGLLARLETARGAALQLATRKAEAAAAAARRDGLEDLAARHTAALERQARAQDRQQAARAELADLSAGVEAARARADTARGALATALSAREAARTALAQARAQDTAERRRAQIAAAHERLAHVAALEAERAPLDATVRQAVPAQVLEDLTAAEREVVRHRTLLEADGTRVELVGAGGVTKDGAPLEAGEWTLTRETRIGLPGGGELVLRPSEALVGAQAALDAAQARCAALLAQWQVSGLAEARARNDAAREASRALETLTARVLAAAPADRDLDLAAGPGRCAPLSPLIPSLPHAPRLTRLRLPAPWLNWRPNRTTPRPPLPGPKRRRAKRRTTRARPRRRRHRSPSRSAPPLPTSPAWRRNWPFSPHTPTSPTSPRRCRPRARLLPPHRSPCNRPKPTPVLSTKPPSPAALTPSPRADGPRKRAAQT
ncbi:hypothetical protein ACFSHP_21700 [Novosphingobium panipatense]